MKIHRINRYVMILTLLGGGVFFLPAGLFAETLPELFQPPAGYQDVEVKRVLSADTVILETDEKIRLIGLKAPEPPQHKVEMDEEGRQITTPDLDLNSAGTTIEDQAFNFVHSLLEKKHVRLEFDERQRDENFVRVAYLFLVEDNTFVNAEILRFGFASLQIRPPNTKYADILRSAYKEARREKRGLQSE